MLIHILQSDTLCNQGIREGEATGPYNDPRFLPEPDIMCRYCVTTLYLMVTAKEPVKAQTLPPPENPDEPIRECYVCGSKVTHQIELTEPGHFFYPQVPDVEAGDVMRLCDRHTAAVRTVQEQIEDPTHLADWLNENQD